MSESKGGNDMEMLEGSAKEAFAGSRAANFIIR